MPSVWKSIGALVGRPKSSFAFSRYGTSRQVSRSVTDLLDKCGTAARAIQIVSETVGSLGAEALPLSDSTEHMAAAERAALLLNRPNQFQGPDEFVESVVFELLAYGNAFIRTPRNGKGEVTAMAPISAYDVRVRARKDASVAYKVLGISKELEAGEILHIRDGATPELISLPRLARIRSRAQALVAADKMINDVFRRGPNVNLFVSMSPASTQDDIDKMQAKLETEFSGAGEGASALVGSDIKVSELAGVKPADADLRELRQDLIREVGSSYGVPPFLLGGSADTRYNNVTARLQALHRDVVATITGRIGRALGRRLGCRVGLNAASLLVGDLMSQAKVATQLAGRPVLTGNEARELIDFDRVEDDESMDAVAAKGSMGANLHMPGDRAGEQPTDDGQARPSDEQLDA